jgi:hypothetical protein
MRHWVRNSALPAAAFEARTGDERPVSDRIANRVALAWMTRFNMCSSADTCARDQYSYSISLK